jgi:hypothetical protein
MNELGIENTFNLTGGILAWNGDLVSPSKAKLKFQKTQLKAIKVSEFIH